MLEFADIVRAVAPVYLEAYGTRMLPSHHRALRDIVACRTPALGGSLYACDDCGTLDYRYHSCRNRSCPKCQDDRAQKWLAKTSARLLPCDHYLLTFTLPSELRRLARAHQKQVYDALLREAAASVLTLADRPEWLGATPAILAVLHTWSRTLEHHPHAHLLVSAGGLSSVGHWVKPAYPRFLMPGYLLSTLFRSRLRAALAREGLVQDIDPDLWERRWTVHVQQIGRGLHAVRYLSRYIYRVALSNRALVRFKDGHVTFRYTHARTRQTRLCTLPVLSFLARFLQHVLPARFTKVRSYGLLSPARSNNLALARHLLESHPAAIACRRRAPEPASTVSDPPITATPERQLCCPACHQPTLRFVGRIPRSRAPP
jgi:hypothetical protein